MIEATFSIKIFLFSAKAIALNFSHFIHFPLGAKISKDTVVLACFNLKTWISEILSLNPKALNLISVQFYFHCIYSSLWYRNLGRLKKTLHRWILQNLLSCFLRLAIHVHLVYLKKKGSEGCLILQPCPVALLAFRKRHQLLS